VPCRQESSDCKRDKRFVNIRLVSAKKLNHLTTQFETGNLKSHVFAWTGSKKEAVVDVNDVASLVNQNIAIVAVLECVSGGEGRGGGVALDKEQTL